ncbi:MAG: RelA/SpoT domain-containing protein [Pseudonocardiaceae bacterium]
MRLTWYATTLGHEPTSRIKTTGTILDKVRRHGGSSLKGMQDLAGMRIVRDCDRTEQDGLTEDLMLLFAKYGNPLPKLVDRRTRPSYGYRALHIIVYIDGAPVEIQLRTQLQHEWADLFEKLADRVGRGIRYGEPPEHWRDQLVSLNIKVGGENPSEGKPEDSSGDIEKVYWMSYRLRESIVRYAHVLSDLIDAYETAESRLSPGELTELNITITDTFAEIRSQIQELWPGPLPENS